MGCAASKADEPARKVSSRQMLARPKVRVLGVIHARCDANDAKAFPHGKPLVDVAGAPLVWRTFLKVRGAKCVSRCVVATDDDRIARVVAALGGEVVRVSGKWGSHTAAAVWETCERLRFWSDGGGGGGGGGGGAKRYQKNLTATVDGGGAESSPSSPFDVVVCVDADEVGIDAHLVERLADAVAGSDAVMGTLACDRPGPPSGGGGDGDERRRRGVGDRRKVGARSYRVSFLPKLSRRSLSNDEDRSSPRGHLAEEAWPCREEREAAACGRTVKREVVAESVPRVGTREELARETARARELLTPPKVRTAGVSARGGASRKNTV